MDSFTRFKACAPTLSPRTRCSSLYSAIESVIPLDSARARWSNTVSCNTFTTWCNCFFFCSGLKCFSFALLLLLLSLLLLADIYCCFVGDNDDTDGEDILLALSFAASFAILSTSFCSSSGLVDNLLLLNGEDSNFFLSSFKRY